MTLLRISLLILGTLPYSISILRAQSNDTLPMTQLGSHDCEKVVNLSTKLLKIRATPGVCEQLADCHFDLGNYADAEASYKKALDMDPSLLECRKKYAEALRIRCKFQEAIREIQIYGSKVDDPKTIDAFMEKCERGLIWRANQGKYLVTPMPEINSQETEIVAYEHNRELYFYSRAKLRNIGKLKKPANIKLPFNLYAYDLANTEPHHPRLVSENCSPNELGLGMAWDEPSDQCYLARFETEGPREGLSSIYRSRRDGYGNVKEVPMPFCKMGRNNNFHPAIDPTGQVLVFVSDCDSGYGGRDLFYCTYQKASGWSNPMNLGIEVNTPNDETYPCFSSEGRLYFASDGHFGFGLTDIFATDFTLNHKEEIDNGKLKIKLYATWTEPINVGARINSPYHDFAIVWKPWNHNNSGYFTSNRPDSLAITEYPQLLDSMNGPCNVYAFDFRPEIVGVISCLDDTGLVDNPSVTLYEDGLPPQVLSSDERGRYFGNPHGKGHAEIVVRKAGFQSMAYEFDLRTIPQGADFRHDFALRRDPSSALNAIPNATNIVSPTNSQSTATIHGPLITPTLKPTAQASLPKNSTAKPNVDSTSKGPLMWSFFYDYGKISLYNVPEKAIQSLKTTLHQDSTLKLDLQIFTSTGGNASARQTIGKKRADEAVRDFSCWLNIPANRISTEWYTPTVKSNFCVACESNAQLKQGRLEVRLQR